MNEKTESLELKVDNLQDVGAELSLDELNGLANVSGGLNTTHCGVRMCGDAGDVFCIVDNGG